MIVLGFQHGSKVQAASHFMTQGPLTIDKKWWVILLEARSACHQSLAVQAPTQTLWKHLSRLAIENHNMRYSSKIPCDHPVVFFYRVFRWICNAGTTTTSSTNGVTPDKAMKGDLTVRTETSPGHGRTLVSGKQSFSRSWWLDGWRTRISKSHR